MNDAQGEFARLSSTSDTPAQTHGRIDEATAHAELIEALAMHAFVTGASERVQRSLGTSCIELGGGVTLAMAHDPTGYWSKTVGLGVTEPVTAELMTEICRFYELSGTQMATIQVAPTLLPPDWSDIAAQHGLVKSPQVWVKLQRKVEGALSVPAVNTRLRIEPVADRHLQWWARVLLQGFGMPAELEALAIGADPQLCRRYAAWDGPTLVGAATVVVRGDAAGMFGASTLPSHRRRGAQSALLAARLRLATDEGARWISAETGQETRDNPNSSLHNLRRAGLADLYERPNWIWRPSE